MNSFERVMACIHGTVKDKPALFLMLSLYGAKLTGCNLEKYYSSASEYVDGQQCVMETFPSDIISSPFSLAKEVLAFGGKIRFYDNQPPNIIKTPLALDDSIDSIVWPDIDANPHLLYFRDSIRKLAMLCGNEIPIVAPWNGPLEMAVCLLGLDRFMEMLLFDRASANDILEKTSQYCIKWGNALLSDGACMLVQPATMANISTITETLAIQTVMPILSKTYSEIQGNILLHHGGGRIQPLLHIYKDLPHLGGVAIDHKDNLSDCREKISSKMLLLGNIDGPTLAYKSVDEIMILTKTILENRIDDPHFILGTTSADIAFNTKKDQINAIIQEVSSFNLEA